jgi:class 3 adenylate cyclase
VLFDARLSALLDSGDDDAVWENYGETWCIMATDLSGFSRGVAEHGIVHYLRVIQRSERLLVPLLEARGGKLLKVEGDSLFVIFERVRDAVQAAIEMQRGARQAGLLLGIGLGYGRVVRVGPADVYGNEVNSACILGETVARDHEILVTQAVRDRVEGHDFEPIEHVPPGAGGAYRLRINSAQ